MKYFKNLNNRNGSILIVTLWIMLILTVLAVSLSFRGGLEAKMAGIYNQRFFDFQKLRAGVEVGMHLIEEDSTPLVDSPSDTWYNSGAQEDLANIEWLEDLEIQIVDEESKINLNAASERTLASLIEVLEERDISLLSDGEDLVGDILFYRGDSARTGGVGIGRKYKKAPFLFLEEIYLLKEFEKEDFSHLQNFVTVYPAKKTSLKVNLNTIGTEVLEAIIGGAAGDARAREDLLEAILDFREGARNDGEPQYFKQSHLSAYQLLEAIGLTRDVKLVSLAVQMLREMVVDSQYFSIMVSVKDRKDRIQAVVGPSGDKESLQDDGARLAILSWKELS